MQPLLRFLGLNASSTFAFATLLAGCLMSGSPLIAQTTEPESAHVNRQPAAADTELSFTDDGKRISIAVGQEPFTVFEYSSFRRPILYPVLGPGQVPMTRSWPMQDVAGEAHDHPHHQSIWTGHEINGVDFWTGKGGSVVVESIITDPTRVRVPNAFRVNSLWRSSVKQNGKQGKAQEQDKTREEADRKEATASEQGLPEANSNGEVVGAKILTDSTLYQFGVGDQSRWVDATITFEARFGPVEFEDTKEGLFAIRTHPDLRLSPAPRNNVPEVFGTAFNSAGERDKAIWGRPAKWVTYQGEIDGQAMSMAMFDHPQNLRHPTTWHARDYGLVAANPFGLHHFLGQELGTGTYSMRKADTLTLRYRVEFIAGRQTAEQIEARFQAFVAEKR